MFLSLNRDDVCLILATNPFLTKVICYLTKFHPNNALTNALGNKSEPNYAFKLEVSSTNFNTQV